MKVLIINESSVRAPRKFIESRCRLIERALRNQKILSAAQAARELTVVFLEPGPARKANLQFRGKDYATDVLSFDAMESGSFGELILCPAVLQRQAKEHGLAYRDELLYMLIHGILHLLGYDHERGPAEEAEMFEIQDKLFAKLLK